jgi:hypothetical protein
LDKIIRVTGTISKNYLIEVFLLFVIETVESYLFAYKRSIITADQKNYLITIVTTVSSMILQVAQIIILIVTRDYVLYLVIRIFDRLIENIIIAKIADKKYPYITTKEKHAIPGY